MKSSQPPPSKRRPGRPRSEAARQSVLAAAYAMLNEPGGRVTIEAVAARAGVGKPTIYRNWPNARALEMAALLEAAQAEPDVEGGSDAIADLTTQLRAVVATFATPRGRQTAQMLATASPDSEISKLFRNQFILKSREQGRTLMTRAIEEQRVRPDLPIETALDMIYGPFFYRLLVGHAPLDDRFVEDLVLVALAGIGSQSIG